LTGGYLVVGQDLDRMIHHDRYSHGAGDAGPALAVSNAEAASGAKARYVAFPREGHGVYVIELRSNAGETSIAYVDPSDGSVNSLEPDGRGAYDLILALHSNLNRSGVLGLRTSTLIGWLGVGWLATLAFGYVASRPHRRTLRQAMRVRRHRGRFTFNLDAHKVIGLVTLVPIVGITLTGIALELRPEARAVVDAITPGRIDPDSATRFKVPTSKPVNGAKRADLGVLAHSLSEAGYRRVDAVQIPVGNPVGAFVAYVDIGGYDPGEGALSSHGRSAAIYADQYSGAVLAADSSGGGSVGQQIIDDYVGGVHFGTFVSWISRAVWVISALGVTALMVTAALMRTGRWRKRGLRASTPTDGSDDDELDGGPGPGSDHEPELDADDHRPIDTTPQPQGAN
jgi:uncharacterized iron-regulated membrane protein